MEPRFFMKSIPRKRDFLFFKHGDDGDEHYTQENNVQNVRGNGYRQAGTDQSTDGAEGHGAEDLLSVVHTAADYVDPAG